MAFAAGVMVLQRMQVHDRHEATGDMPGWEKRRRQIEEKKTQYTSLSSFSQSM